MAHRESRQFAETLAAGRTGRRWGGERCGGNKLQFFWPR